MESRPLSLTVADASTVKRIASTNDTPFYIYSIAKLRQAAESVIGFGGPFGFTPRFAVKANPHYEIITLFNGMGLHFDASSGGEADLLLDAGVPPEHIVLNSQAIPKNLRELLAAGVRFTATSLHQLETFASLNISKDVAVRINPGMGSGANNRLTTGGVNAAFGIWHEYIPKVLQLAKQHSLEITKIHTHIGSGTDPKAWEAAAHLTLEIVEQFPDCVTVNLGGGFKVGRMPHESSSDMPEIASYIHNLLIAFDDKYGRQLHLEIEPGTYLVANAGALVSSIIDITDTGENGYEFIRLDTGMNDLLRPSLYGAQHPIVSLSDNTEEKDYVVVGHCCESGDILTTAPGNPEMIEPRTLRQSAIGDLVCIEGAGAYCASMRAHGYNAYPSAKEVVIE